MPPDLTVIWVAAGTALGALARFEITRRWILRHGDVFPWSTLWINLGGAFLAGCVVARVGAMPEGLVHFLAAGVLGGFTTVSSFGLETVLMIERGRNRAALAYVGASLLGGVAAAGLALAAFG